MSALTADRIMPRKSFFREIALPCAASVKFYRNAAVVFDVSDVSAKPAGTGTDTDCLSLGLALNAPDNSSGSKGDKKVLVDLAEPVECIVLENDSGGGAITEAANLLQVVYWLDDQTVTATSTNNAKAGRLWKVDADGRCHVQLHATDA